MVYKYEFIHFNVGQGDSALWLIYQYDKIHKSILIDCGGNKGGIGKQRIDHLKDVLKREKVSKIDIIIISHNHRDHYNYLKDLLSDVSFNSVFNNTILFEQEGDQEKTPYKALFSVSNRLTTSIIF